MNMTLTTALAVLAGLVLVAVVLHGAWSARRSGPRQPRADADSPRREPALGEAPAARRTEPGLGAAMPPAASAGAVDPALGIAPGDALGDALGHASPGFAAALPDGLGDIAPGGPEGGIDPLQSAAVPAQGPSTIAAPPAGSALAAMPVGPAAGALPAGGRRIARIDALIDVIVPLALEAPVSAEAAMQHLPPSRRAGNKFIHVEGLDSQSGEWEPLQPGQRYKELQAAVQLANRHGALNEIEFSEFVQKVEAYAESLGAMADVPDMLDAVARARELDLFASGHDAQLTAGLRANSVAWSVGYIQQCAQRHGFVPGAVPGRMVMPAAEDGAPPLLVLAFDPQAALSDDPNRAAVRDLSLSLDVPQTAESVGPFEAWQVSARALADELDATLIDDQNAPITLHAFAAIEGELKRLYQALESHDLAAGSAAARRLFS